MATAPLTAVAIYHQHLRQLQRQARAQQKAARASGDSTTIGILQMPDSPQQAARILMALTRGEVVTPDRVIRVTKKGGR